MDTSKLLAEMGSVFGQGFVESVSDVFYEDDIDEALLQPQSASQQKRDAARPKALKKALAAFDREHHRGEKKRGVEQHRKMKADIEKRAAAAKDDPDEYKNILKSLRAKKAGEHSKSKAEPKKSKAEPRKSKGADGAGPGGGGDKAGFAGAAGSGGARADQKKQKAALGSGGKSQHYPFSNSANLGKGPGTPPVPVKHPRGPVNHDKKKCWNCDCGPVYTKGCMCTGTGKTPDCPQGRKKRVKIRYDYRQAYNKMYHAWRAKKGGEVTARIKAGGGK